MELLTAYHNALVEPRVLFSQKIQHALQTADADRLAFFLIYSAALGVGMYKPARRWMRMAGKRAIKQGYASLGEAFLVRSDQVGALHRYLIHDVHCLTRWWAGQQRVVPVVRPYQYVRRPSIKAYQAFRRLMIKGDGAYQHLAVEFEIERVAALQGFTLLKLSMLTWGSSILRHMSFMRHQIRQHQSGSFSQMQLSSLLSTHPEVLPSLVEAGCQALSVYADYVLDCIALSEQAADKQSERVLSTSLGY